MYNDGHIIEKEQGIKYESRMKTLSLALLTLIQPPIELGETWNSTDVSNTEKIISVMRDRLLQDTGRAPVMKRDAHPKYHGCVKANLQINVAGLNPAYQKGLFGQNGSYGAVVRFSNGDPNPNQHDSKGDVRGMATKVFGPEGVHDLVFVNSPVFFLNSSDDYVDFIKAFNKGGASILWFLTTHPSTAKTLLRISSAEVNNPLDLNYHSATPYKLGPRSMKMKFESCKRVKDSAPQAADPNFLSKRLARTLEYQSTCFDLYIQPNITGNTIERPMDLWDPQSNPFYKVGRLTIPAQTDIHSEARNEFCENVSFNPWRAPEANRPLGTINRMRMSIYSRQADFRQSYNRVADPAPANLDDVP